MKLIHDEAVAALASPPPEPQRDEKSDAAPDRSPAPEVVESFKEAVLLEAAHLNYFQSKGAHWKLRNLLDAALASLPSESTQVDESGSSKRHMRQSINGCVTCPRPWSEHTAAERGEPPASQSGSSEPSTPFADQGASVFIVCRNPGGEVMAVFNNLDDAHENLDIRTGRGARPDLEDRYYVESWHVSGDVGDTGRYRRLDPCDARAASPKGERASAQAVAPELDADHIRIALEDWLTYWSGDDDEWEPEMTDGCRPQPCDCGFLALVHQSRLALGRPCCGEVEHPGMIAVAYADADREAGE
jgi:hypothetical protein